MLKEILSITGKSGLYKLVSRGRNMLIVESLVDGKRTPALGSDKVVSLDDISIFTKNEDIHLSVVLKTLFEKEKGQVCALNPKSDKNVLFNFMAEILPDFDSERVYPNNISKIIQWYNILVSNGITDFEHKEKETENSEGKPAAETKEKEIAPKKQVQKSAATKVQSKAIQTTKGTRTKV